MRRKRKKLNECMSTDPRVLDNGLPVGRDHEGMCPTYSERALDRSIRAPHGLAPFMAVWPGPYKKKHKRIKCPTCGRRMLARLTFCHDACCAIYALPPHKKKGWWKKTKKTKKTRETRHRRFRATRRG